MATFHFDLVSPEKLAFSGEVDQVDVPGVEGDFGVLAGHAPVVAAIRPGILTVTSGGTQQKIIVLGGLAEVSDKGLTVLADVATSIEDLDRAQFADTDLRDGSQARGKGRLGTRPRDRAARSFQEHPEPAQRYGAALAVHRAGFRKPYEYEHFHDAGRAPKPGCARCLLAAFCGH